MSDKSKVQAAIADKINQLYGNEVFTASSMAAGGEKSSDSQASFTAQSLTAAGNGNAPSVPAAGDGGDGGARQLPPLSVNPTLLSSG